MADKNRTVPVTTGAEAFLEQVRALGVVRYMFANTGTDHGPLIEAMARTAREDPRDIQPIVVPHELAAVSMAHGYYNVTQKPQMVLVHTLPGRPTRWAASSTLIPPMCRFFSSPAERRSPRANCAAERARTFTGARNRATREISSASS